MLLLATAARSSRSTVASASRVRITRTQPGFERGLQPPRHAERDVFFKRAAGPVRAIFGAAVAGVDNDRPDATGRGRSRTGLAGQSPGPLAVERRSELARSSTR